MAQRAESAVGIAPAEIRNRPRLKPSPVRVVRSTAVKELRITRRYIPNLVGRFVEVGVRVGFFFLLSGIVSVNAADSPLGKPITGSNLAIFFEGALLLFVLTPTALYAPVNAVTNDLYNGTMEYLFSCPSSRYAYFVGTVVASAAISSVVFAPLYLLLVLYSGSSLVNTLLILLVCGIVVLTVMAFGVMIGVLAILWRQVESIGQVLGILFELLAGAYFPVAAYPVALQVVAGFLPYTWGYDLIRYYSFNRSWDTLLPVWLEWSLIGVYAVIYVALSRVLLRRAEALAKRRGLQLI
jgi:ABC-2 type transport system permease protein